MSQDLKKELEKFGNIHIGKTRHNTAHIEKVEEERKKRVFPETLEAEDPQFLKALR